MIRFVALPLASLLLLPALAQDAATTAAPSADASTTAPAQWPEFTALFTAPDLSDGVIRGGTAKYERSADGVITGQPTTVGGLNTFLCSPKEYHNFVLRYAFHVDPALNSGVQIRSSVVDHKDEREVVGGPQIEIDTDPRRNRQWSAGIFGERVAPWLFPADDADDSVKQAFTEQGREVTKIDDWNEVVVLAVGPRITTWLNGTLRADLAESPTEKGFIGLQVHNVTGESLLDKVVRFRNVGIIELPDDVSYDSTRSAIESLVSQPAPAAP